MSYRHWELRKECLTDVECDKILWLDTKESVSYSKIQVRAHNALKNELTVALDLLW